MIGLWIASGVIIFLMLIALVFVWYSFRRLEKNQKTIYDGGKEFDKKEVNNELFDLLERNEYKLAEEKIDWIIEKSGMGRFDDSRLHYENIRANIYRGLADTVDDPIPYLEKALKIYTDNLDHPKLLTHPHEKVELETEIRKVQYFIRRSKEKEKDNGGDDLG